MRTEKQRERTWILWAAFCIVAAVAAPRVGAEVRYTDLSDLRVECDLYDIDFDQDGSPDLRAVHDCPIDDPDSNITALVAPLMTAMIMSGPPTEAGGFSMQPIRLAPGSQIGMSSWFPNVIPFFSTGHEMGGPNPNNWTGQSGFVGFKFNIQGYTHFGWLQVSIDEIQAPTLHDYAYEDVPGRSILAGAIAGSHAGGDINNDGFVDDNDLSLVLANWTGTGQGDELPEPSTLGLLAAGVVIAAVRRRR